MEDDEEQQQTQSLQSLASTFWDIKMPPVKKHIVGGRMVPTVKAAMGGFLLSKNRRISLEIRGPLEGTTAEGLDPFQKKRELEKILSGNATSDAMDLLSGDDFIALRVLKERQDYDDDEDDTIVADDPDLEDDHHDDKHWATHGSYRLEAISVVRTHHRGKSVEVRLGTGQEAVIRDLKFASSSAAEDFAHALDACEQLSLARARRQIQEFQTSSRGVADDTTSDAENVKLLIELVSATDLPVADLNTSDPYAICRFGETEIHRTQVMDNTLNPIFTLQTGSLFSIEKTTTAFFQSGGLTITLKDFDSVGANDVLGSCHLSAEELLKGTGERTAYKIEPGKNVKVGSKPPKLYLRVKPATDSDLEVRFPDFNFMYFSLPTLTLVNCSLFETSSKIRKRQVSTRTRLICPLVLPTRK